MAFVNATPHLVTIYKDDDTVLAIPTCGVVIRVDETREVCEIVEGIDLHVVKYGDVIGLDQLPGLTSDDIVIVSALALAALKASGEALSYDFGFASPGESVRNADGQIIGCKGLTVL